MIDATARAYLDAADRVRPGYVRGLYLVGSTALGAWQPGVSDVDTVILTSRPAGDDDLAALAEIHAGMPRSPYFDGVYIEPDLVGCWPADRRAVPFVVRGQFTTGTPCGELTPVLWLTLRRHGIAVRGPAVADLKVRVDPGELRRYNLDNLRDYWCAEAANIAAAMAGADPDEVMDAESVTWCVLGPARLHHTLAHGDVISKSAAGTYLAQLFPAYADLARRAIRWRAGEPERFTAADLTAAGHSMVAVADDAWRRFGA
jgi:nucleotidyltransferase-like protein